MPFAISFIKQQYQTQLRLIVILIRYQSLMNDQEIVVVVTSPQQRSEIAGVNKFMVYRIKGKDQKGDIQILRRYSDFNLLRQILTKRWPGCYIPSLPEKRTIGANQHLFVESRRRGLQIFLMSLSFLEPMWYSDEMQIFLKNTSAQSDKLLAPLIKQSPDRLMMRYQTTFESFHKDSTSEASAKITQFGSYIKDSRIFLEKLSESAQKMIDVFRVNVQKKLSLIEFIMPDYEKGCILENDEKNRAESLLFTVENFQIKQALTDYKKASDYPSVMHVSEEIKRERRELEALEEIIKTRHEFQSLKMKAINKVKDCEISESKISAGKESLFSKITNKTKEQQMSQTLKQKEQAKEQQKMYETISTIVTNLLGGRQIDRFKQIRQKSYYLMLRAFAQSQKQIAMTEHEVWARASEHDRIWEEGFEESLGLKAKDFKPIKEKRGQEEEKKREDVDREEEKKQKQVQKGEQNQVSGQQLQRKGQGQL